MTTILVVAALLGFAALVGSAIYQTWLTETTPSFSDSYLYLATALTGLVGGVVAAGFGQKLPQSAPGAAPGRLARNIGGLAEVVMLGRAPEKKQTVAALYAIVYVVLGLAAIATWAYRGDMTPDLVKNLASVAGGLFLAIISAFMTEPGAVPDRERSATRQAHAR